MKNSETVQSLVESPKIYNIVSDRLDLIENPSINFESELMQIILDFYSSDEEQLPTEKLQKFSLSQILQYIQASHKLYLTKTLPEIEQSMAHIQRRFEDTPAVLSALILFFNEYKTKFLNHIRMEEREFFPYLKKLIAASEGKLSSEEIKEMLNKNSIDDFSDEHDSIEDELKKVSEIIHEFSEKQNITLPFKVFLNQVELFEMELRKHAIIEDYVLVPMAIQIEKKLRA